MLVPRRVIVSNDFQVQYLLFLSSVHGFNLSMGTLMTQTLSHVMCWKLWGFSCFRSNQNKGDTRVTKLHMIINPWETRITWWSLIFRTWWFSTLGFLRVYLSSSKAFSAFYKSENVSLSPSIFWEKGKVLLNLVFHDMYQCIWGWFRWFPIYPIF